MKFNGNKDIHNILKIAKLTAQIILENGGETYRVEDTVTRICQSFSLKDVDTIALPTGFFISISQDGIENHTAIKRVKKRTVNLAKVNEANKISRLLTEKSITLEQALIQLQELTTITPPKKVFPMMAAALSSGFFALLFGGTLFDLLTAALCGAIVQLVSYIIKDEDQFHFIFSLIGGMLTACIAITFTYIFDQGNLDLIISGAIMPLLPGLAMTNAIRDTIRGDLVSGVARGTEALIVAVALAIGVGIILKACYYMGGGLLSL